MSDLRYDKKSGKRVSVNQLRRRGLLGLTDRFIELSIDHGYDTDLYIAVDSGSVELSEDETTASVVFTRKNKISDEENNFDVREVMKDKVNERRDTLFASGIDISFDGATHTLQTRGVDDLLNWTTLKSEVEKLDDGTAVYVRTESNETLTINSEDVYAMLSSGMEYINSVRSASWSIKDNIRDAATDDDAFTEYETGMETLWPDKVTISVPASE